MTTSSSCSKCGGALQEGFIFDRGDGNYKQRQIWVEGAAEESFWSGIKTSGRAAFNVRAMRCAGCGFLEFYAADQTDLSGAFSGLFTN